MINKNQYRKTDTKKVLHKVGKQWKVISTALLLAVAGGAVAATHANANADAVNTQPYAANQAIIPQKPASNNAKSAAPASSASVGYYPAASGSAAYYFDRVASDNDVAAKNFNTVNNYVQSLNNEYNPQVHSYSVMSASASAAAKNDASLAKSYSAVNTNPNTAKTVQSLANKNHIIDPNVYEGMVQGQEEAFSGEVKSASADVKANSDVASLVNKLQGTNLSATSLNASASSAIANSNFSAALSNRAAVSAKYGNGNTTAAKFVDIANELSAGATTLNELPNDTMYNADVDQLNHGFNTTQNANLDASLTSDTNSALASAVSEISGYASNAVSGSTDTTPAFNALSAYAKGSFNNIIDHDNAHLYSAAVSAAVNPRLAGALESVATSLYGKYNPEFATSSELSKEASAAEQSANNKVTAASYANAYANANSTIVSNVSAAVQSVYDKQPNNAKNENDAKAEVAQSYLNSGVTSFASDVGYDINESTVTSVVSNQSDFNSALSSIVSTASNSSASSYASDVEAALGFQSNTTMKNSIADELTSVADVVSDFANSVTVTSMSYAYSMAVSAKAANSSYNFDNSAFTSLTQTNGSSVTADIVSDAIAKLQNTPNTSTGYQSLRSVGSALSSINSTSAIISTGDISANSVATTTLNSLLNSLATNLYSDASAANAVSPSYDANKFDSLATTNGLKSTGNTTPVENPVDNSADDVEAALLSDGIDLASLEAESGAINNVITNEQSAVRNSSDIRSMKNSAAQLNAALSVANSSANSAFSSANNASIANSSANDDDVTLASYFANSYSADANSESTVASSVSSETNSFFINMASDNDFTVADNAYAGAEAAAANDKMMGVEYSKVVFNNSPHFLDALKGARLHSSYEYGSQYDKVVGNVNKGDRLTVLGVNFSREGLIHGATRYLVLDNNNGKKGFFTGQPQFSKAAYLNAVYDTNNVDVSVKTLKPVVVRDNINGGKVVKTLPAGSVVDGVTVVSDNANNDAMGFTKIETSDYNFFTANTDYVELNKVVPKNNNNNNENSNFNFNLDNVDLAHAYNDNSQY